jgi:hypothetical protein
MSGIHSGSNPLLHPTCVLRSKNSSYFISFPLTHFLPSHDTVVVFMAHVEIARLRRRTVRARFDVDQYAWATVLVKLSAWCQVVQFAGASVFHKKSVAFVRDQTVFHNLHDIHLTLLYFEATDYRA